MTAPGIPKDIIEACQETRRLARLTADYLHQLGHRFRPGEPPAHADPIKAMETLKRLEQELTRIEAALGLPPPKEIPPC